MRRRIFFIGVLSATAAWFGRRALRNMFEITNRSGHALQGLTVEVCGSVFDFGDLPAGQSVGKQFEMEGNEASFHITGRLHGGTMVREHCGYAVWEDVVKVFRFDIQPDGSIDEIR